MTSRPTGTVTFLFTDIEGSTKLAQQYPDEMPSLLRRHHEILHQVMQAHNGYVFRIAGDSFSVAFHTGRADWKDKLNEPEYEGYATLALTQRIMSAGHGGQILVSQSVFDLTQDHLPEQAQFVDRGERELKDVLRPQHIYQLVVPGLPAEFPPLNTLEFFKHNLP